MVIICKFVATKTSNAPQIWIDEYLIYCNTREKKRDLKNVGYLSKSFCSVNFIINIVKGVLRN